ncbi:MAG: fumarylacetoacetate hydrolase family protein [Wenzhouxiangella sp.]|nr:fumarylacetoacetate hydrolase family protein [Wenzhouxiangella sp.]
MSDQVQWYPPRLQVAGGGCFPVRNVWCVGRNYAEHAREMGADPDRGTPVFFSKPAQALCQAREIAYPPETNELHHEVELVVFLRSGGRNLEADQAQAAIFGYAIGVDLTRRDAQSAAKKQGHPWEMSKGFDQAGPVGTICPAADWQPEASMAIQLSVDGLLRQNAKLGDMLWSVPDLLVSLSRTVTLSAGDAVFTGTPAGVAELLPGQRVRGHIDGLPELGFRIAA